MIRAAIGYMGAKRIFTSTNNISIAYQQKDKATKPKLPIPRGFRHRPLFNKSWNPYRASFNTFPFRKARALATVIRLSLFIMIDSGLSIGDSLTL
jgi:hypothetical protein